MEIGRYARRRRHNTHFRHTDALGGLSDSDAVLAIEESSQQKSNATRKPDDKRIPKNGENTCTDFYKSGAQGQHSAVFDRCNTRGPAVMNPWLYSVWSTLGISVAFDNGP